MKCLVLASFMALALLLGACGAVDADEPIARIVFFNAGSADAILIETHSSAVLVDAGLRDGAQDLVRALSDEGIHRLDLLIITHFDKDHVGGASEVIGSMPVRAVYEPDYAKDSKHVDAYREALFAASITPTALSENAGFELDGVRYEIDVANESFYGDDEENDFSLVIRLTAGSATALLTGDAEKARIMELLDEGDLQNALLKVPHHGRYEKVSPLLFEAVHAGDAVISTGEDEPEDSETVQALKMAGSRVWLTRQGTIVAETDGQDWTLRQE